MSYLVALFAIVWITRLVLQHIDNRSASKPQSSPFHGDPPSAASDSGLVRDDLIKLNKVEPGLGDAAIAYVLQGMNDTVLLRLDKNQQAVSSALGQSYWGSAGNWRTGRSDFLLASPSWRPDAIRRYGEVLDFLYKTNTWLSLPGSDKSPRWFRVILHEYGQARAAVTDKNLRWKTAPAARAKEPWTIERLADLLGDDLTPILDAAFSQDETAYRKEPGSPEHMPGFEAHLRSDPERRLKELRTLGAKPRSSALRKFAQLKMNQGPYFDFAFEQTGDGAKSVREAASLLLRSASPDVLLERVRGAWPKLKAAQKSEMSALVAARCGEAGAALLRDLGAEEKSESVRADILRRLGEDVLAAPAAQNGVRDGAEGYTAQDGRWIDAPPPPSLPADTPLSPALRDLVRQAFELWREEATRQNKEREGEKYFYRQQVPHTNAADQYMDLMEGKRAMAEQEIGVDIWSDWGLGKARQALRDQILNHPDLTLWHIARTQADSRGRYDYGNRTHAAFLATSVGRAIRARLGPARDLRVYSDVCTALGSLPDAAARHLLITQYWRPDLDEWPADSLWPYFLRHLDMIDACLGLAPAPQGVELAETSALDILGRFPVTPARYTQALLDRAVGDRKSVRPACRQLLAQTPGLTDVLQPLLKHPKSEMRTGGAHWLGDLKSEVALPALLAAARKEQIPAAKAAMLSSISRLGGEIGEFVSAKALLGEAEAGLKKTPGKGLEWFPFDGLPTVRRKDGAPLDARVIRWWLLLAVKLKQPGGNPWFDLLLDELDPGDAARFGLAVLQAFVAHDTAAPSEEEANAYAAGQVDATLAQYRRWDAAVTREQIFSMLRRQKLTAYYGSANDQKGVLALCVRAPGADAVNIVKAYFRDHYTRTAQCKALIECLAGNPSPLTIQFVLSIAKRWRTRGVQELAGQLVEAIAERRGWTAEELADRTIPTGGFDEAGVLDLPIGLRSYQARLDGAGRITLHNPDGKLVQGLPASAAGDAAESLKEAKAALSAGRKEVKQAWDFQTRRLYEALCVEREWPAADWAEHILRHPIAGRLASRLIWMGLDDKGGKLGVFRPLEDLTLTDAADAAVDIADFARLRLAHGAAMTPDEVVAWKTHLADYEVDPLFDQLSRPLLSAADGTATEIVDRKGWMIEAFKLRGAAAKLGYTRGAAEDGGVFMTYEKPFDALKTVAIIEFTGNSLPEENRPSALVALRFIRQKKTNGWMDWNTGLPLKDVPDVLLSEVWNDFHAMAAAGAGFDAEWENKAGW